MWILLHWFLGILINNIPTCQHNDNGTYEDKSTSNPLNVIYVVFTLVQVYINFLKKIYEQPQNSRRHKGNKIVSSIIMNNKY